MNDQQLIDALRAIGTRTAEPDPGFAEQLWRALPRRRIRARAPIRRELLLVALLALAGLAAALVVGSSLLKNDLLVDASLAPSPGPSQAVNPPPWPVYVPQGLQTRSAVRDVAAVALAAFNPDLSGGIVTSVAVLPPGVEFPAAGGGWTSRSEAVWGVQVSKRDVAVVLVVDGSLEVAGTLLRPAPAPGATPGPQPTVDPGTVIDLVSDRGRTVSAEVVSIAPADMPAATWPPAVQAANLWLLLGATDEPGPTHLVRIDTGTGAATVFDLPEGLYTSVRAGRDRVWLQSDGGVHEVDPGSGVIRRTFQSPPDGSLLGEDDLGLWFRAAITTPSSGGGSQTAGGAVLVDPETGFSVRRIMFRETGDQAYTGFWQPPAFGSLWDVDRGAGLVHRFDVVTGAIVATVEIPTTNPQLCNDPRPATGVEGLPPLVIVDCSDTTVLIDSARNALLRALPMAARPPFGSSFAAVNDPVAAAGSFWATLVNPSDGVDQVGWWYPGGLMRLDPVTGGPLETLILSRVRPQVVLPVVAGDSMWLTFGSHSLLRITLTDLAG